MQPSKYGAHAQVRRRGARGVPVAQEVECGQQGQGEPDGEWNKDGIGKASGGERGGERGMRALGLVRSSCIE